MLEGKTMQTNIDNLFVSYLLLDEKTRLRKAQKATNKLAKYLTDETQYTDKQVFRFYVNVVSLFVSADHECGREEWKLFNAILDGQYSYDTFYQYTDGGSNPEFQERMFRQIAALPKKIRDAIITIGLAFSISEKELSDSERAIIERIIKGQ